MLLLLKASLGTVQWRTCVIFIFVDVKVHNYESNALKRFLNVLLTPKSLNVIFLILFTFSEKIKTDYTCPGSIYILYFISKNFKLSNKRIML